MFFLFKGGIIQVPCEPREKKKPLTFQYNNPYNGLLQSPHKWGSKITPKNNQNNQGYFHCSCYFSRVYPISTIHCIGDGHPTFDRESV